MYAYVYGETTVSAGVYFCHMLFYDFRQLSGKEIYAGGATVATEQVLFTVNWRDDITTAHIVRYRGVLYDITRVDVFEGYKGDITLFCKLRPKS